MESMELDKIKKELEQDIKDILFDGYQYLFYRFKGNEISLSWSELQYLRTEGNNKSIVFNIISVPIIKTSDKKPIGLFVFKFKNKKPNGKIKIIASSFQFISMSW
jgi:hypothetical protein